MHLISGKELATQIQDTLAEEIASLPFVPHLAVLLVGDDPASLLYVNLKKKTGEALGMEIDIHHLPAHTPDTQLKALVESWNQNQDIDGILIQVPLPDGHDESALIAVMDPQKDVDGFHPVNIAALMQGEPRVISPVHEGILRLIAQSPTRVTERKTALICNSEIFSNPLERLLRSAGAFVESMSPDALNTDFLKEADIVVIAIGRLNFLQPSMTKSTAVIIDVGTNRLKDHRVAGDADRNAYQNTDVYLTPVPGGVGPMTIAQLLKNVVELGKKRREI